MRRRQTAAETAQPSTGWPQWQFALVLATGLLFCAGVVGEWDLLNEAWAKTGWAWAWRNLGVGRTAGFMLPGMLLIAWIVWRADRDSSAARPWLCAGLLGLANYLLQMLAMLGNPGGLEWLKALVLSGMATSYFGDARAIRHPIGWLAQFHQIGLGVHSSTHPPGPILFYYLFIKLFGVVGGALAGGCMVGLLGSAGVLVMYRFAGLWTADARSRISCCALYALIPALIVFFPEFDQVYPVLSMLLIFFWVSALRGEVGVPWSAVGVGAVLFAATFFAYNLLATGVFLAYYALYLLWQSRWAAEVWVRVLRTSAVLIAVYGAVQAALWLATGYHPVAAFRTALHKQGLLAAYVHRSYRAFVMMDPYDFVLGAGILAFLLVVFYLRRMWPGRADKPDELALTLIGLATIATVDVSGLLRAESARVWLFLQPLLIVPAGLELARADWRRRCWVLAVQWLIVVCLQAKMSFLFP